MATNTTVPQISPTMETSELKMPGDMGRASYEAGASAGRYMSNWFPALMSADLATLPEQDDTSARAMDAFRNDPIIKNAIIIGRDSIIGSGFRLKLNPDHVVLGIKREDAYEWARMAEREFSLHAESPINCHADARGVQTLSSLMQTCIVSRMVKGNAIGLVRMKRRSTTPDMTCLRIVDPDRLANPADQEDGDRFRKGIEMDADAAPIRYHFRKRHPNDFSSYNDFARFSVRRRDNVGRPLVVHSFDTSLIDLSQGISEIVSALVPARMNSEFARVHLETAIAQSIFAASIKSDLDYTKAMEVIGAEQRSTWFAQKGGMDPNAAMQLSYLNSMSGFYRERNISLQGAQVQHLAPHEELVLHRANATDTGAADFEAAGHRRVAAGTGSGVHNMSQNYQQLSYASGRIAETNTWRGFEVKRDDISNDIGMPYASAFLEERIMTGRMKMPAGVTDFYQFRDALCRGKFMSWGRPVIDPVKERKGQQLQLGMGTISRRMICEQEGVVLEDVIDDLAQEIKLFDDAGVPLPTGVEFSASAGEADGDSDDPDEDELKEEAKEEAAANA